MKLLFPTWLSRVSVPFVPRSSLCERQEGGWFSKNGKRQTAKTRNCGLDGFEKFFLWGWGPARERQTDPVPSTPSRQESSPIQSVLIKKTIFPSLFFIRAHDPLFLLPSFPAPDQLSHPPRSHGRVALPDQQKRDFRSVLIEQTFSSVISPSSRYPLQPDLVSSLDIINGKKKTGRFGGRKTEEERGGNLGYASQEEVCGNLDG